MKRSPQGSMPCISLRTANRSAGCVLPSSSITTPASAPAPLITPSSSRISVQRAPGTSAALAKCISSDVFSARGRVGDGSRGDGEGVMAQAGVARGRDESLQGKAQEQGRMTDLPKRHSSARSSPSSSDRATISPSRLSAAHEGAEEGHAAHSADGAAACAAAVASAVLVPAGVVMHSLRLLASHSFTSCCCMVRTCCRKDRAHRRSIEDAAVVTTTTTTTISHHHEHQNQRRAHTRSDGTRLSRSKAQPSALGVGTGGAQCPRWLARNSRRT